MRLRRSLVCSNDSLPTFAPGLSLKLRVPMHSLMCDSPLRSGGEPERVLHCAEYFRLMM